MGRWTGSMREGLAIGLDGIEHAEIRGGRVTDLADYAKDSILGQPGISIRIPFNDLVHLDGMPRYLRRVLSASRRNP